MTNGIINANPNPKLQTSKTERGIPFRMRHGNTIDVRVNIPPIRLRSCLSAARFFPNKSTTFYGFKDKKKGESWLFSFLCTASREVSLGEVGARVDSAECNVVREPLEETYEIWWNHGPAVESRRPQHTVIPFGVRKMNERLVGSILEPSGRELESA
jgi:hypothetical protein